MLTREQKRRRRQGLGGSDIAAILGMSPWRSPVDVYLDKTTAVEIEETPAMRFGSLLEPVIVEEYKRLTGHQVQTGLPMIMHPRFPELPMIASLDGVMTLEDGRNGVLEIKTAGSKKAGEWGEEWTSAVPDWYALQVHHYMTVTGFEVAHICVLFLIERRCAVYEIPADPEISSMIETAAAEFWTSHVVALEPPEPRSVADAKALWPMSFGAPIRATDSAIASVERLKFLKSAARKTASECDKEETAIRAFMGAASELVNGNKIIATLREDRNHRRTLRLKS